MTWYFIVTGIGFLIWAAFAFFVLAFPDGAASYAAADIYCDFGHRDHHVVIKRTIATEKWLCMKCGRKHLKMRHDAFD